MIANNRTAQIRYLWPAIMGLLIGSRWIVPYGGIKECLYDVMLLLFGVLYGRLMTLQMADSAHRSPEISDAAKRALVFFKTVVILVAISLSVGAFYVLNSFIHSSHVFPILFGLICLFAGQIIGGRIAGVLTHG